MHIAFILDGNRRWAKKRLLPAAIGHKKGIERFEQLILHIAREKKDITAVTAFALSTENLNRNPKELKNLFELFLRFAAKSQEYLAENIRVRFWGNRNLLPKKLQESFAQMEEDTREATGLQLNLCVAYGGRDAIVRAGQALAASGESWSEEALGRQLESATSPPLDLLIRTGGKYRISNFLLWEVAYAELYFSEKMWPAFDKKELEKALSFFHEQKRTFGK